MRVTTVTMVPRVERRVTGKKEESRQRIRRSDELSNQRSLKQRVEQSRGETAMKKIWTSAWIPRRPPLVFPVIRILSNTNRPDCARYRFNRNKHDITACNSCSFELAFTFSFSRVRLKLLQTANYFPTSFERWIKVAIARNLICSRRHYSKQIRPTRTIISGIVSTETSCIEIARGTCPDFVVWSRSSLGKWKIPNETRVARRGTSSPLHICGQNPRRTDETRWPPRRRRGKIQLLR